MDIERLEKEGTGDILEDLRNLANIPEEEQVSAVEDIIERIEYELLTGTGYATLIPSEARARYKMLLNALPNMTGIKKEQKRLTILIENKINELKKIELKNVQAHLNDKVAIQNEINEIAKEEGVSLKDAELIFFDKWNEKLANLTRQIELYESDIQQGNSEHSDTER